MGILRVLVGTAFCLAAAILIAFFVGMGAPITQVAELGTSAPYLVMFAVLLNPVSAIMVSAWWVIAALGVGALIGGLISKSPLAGLAVGILSFAVILMLFLGLTIGFNVNLWINWVTALNSNVAVELLLCVGILAGVGAIGGKLTAGSD